LRYSLVPSASESFWAASSGVSTCNVASSCAEQNGDGGLQAGCFRCD
jgi:hypothetical protein